VSPHADIGSVSGHGDLDKASGDNTEANSQQRLYQSWPAVATAARPLQLIGSAARKARLLACFGLAL